MFSGVPYNIANILKDHCRHLSMASENSHMQSHNIVASSNVALHTYKLLLSIASILKDQL